MTAPYYQDGPVTLHHGDYQLAATVLADAANAAVGAPDTLVEAVFPELMNVARHLTGSAT